jgi:hypothetical protein
MANRIKKVQIIRIKAFGGKLSDKQEVLAEVPSIKMAEAAVREWQQLGHLAQQSVLNTSEKTPAEHYGCNIWEQNHVEDESFGYDRYWCEDFWHSGKRILSERIYTHVVR